MHTPTLPTLPAQRFNNADGTGPGSAQHDVAAYEVWCAARQARRAAEQPPSIDVIIDKLCPADRDYVAAFFENIALFAESKLDKEECAELADRKFRLPSLRGHLPTEERPRVRLELVPAGWTPELTSVSVGAVWNDGAVHKDHYVVWVEDRGEQTYSLCVQQRDKYGWFDSVIEELPDDALLTLSEEQAKSLGLVNPDLTLAEMLGIRYCERFSNIE